MIEPTQLIGYLGIGVLLSLVGLLIVGVAHLAARRMPSSPVVEFLPPETGDIFVHGLALRADNRVLAAAVIELAVRGQARVLTTSRRRGPVAVQVRPDAALTSEQHQLFSAFRPSRFTPRQARRFVQALGKIGIRVERPEDAPGVFFLRGRGTFRRHRRRELTRFFDATRQRLTGEGLTRSWANPVHLVLLSVLFLATAATGLVLALGAAVNGQWLGTVVVLVDVALVFWVLTLSPPPLLRFTDEGQVLRRHLDGLRDYMAMAEQERLRVLQSPEGALRTPAGALTVGGQILGLEAQPAAGDPVAQSTLDRFVLTERLLPYAVLFRQENAWQKEFERLGGTVAISSQNMRTLGATLEGTMALLEAVSIILQVLRIIGAVLSLFRRS